MSTPMTTPDTIAALVAKARRGDREAFAEIYRRYEGRLRSQIGSRMPAGAGRKVEVDDVLQETLGCALESLPTLCYRDEESLYRWLAGIAEHVIWNVSRKKAGSELQLLRDISGSGSSAAKGLRREERFERLEKALRSLSAEHREVLLLARIEGLPVSEIAARMERSPNAVKKLLGRALLELKKSFGDTESLSLPERRLGGAEEAEHDA